MWYRSICSALLCSSILICSSAKSIDKSEIQIEITRDINCASTRKARAGDKVTVHYGGFLQDGKKFDSSFDRSQPFTFTLGVGQVIPGWDQGLLGVCKGEERHLVVPAQHAYGERGAGDVIPPGATLLFDIVIVDVERIDTEEDPEEMDRKQKEKEEKERLEELQRREEDEKNREEELQKREEELKRREDEEENRKLEQRRRDEEEERRAEELERRREAEVRVKQDEEARIKEEKERKNELERRREEQERVREEEKRREEELKRREEENKRREGDKKRGGSKVAEGTRRKEDQEAEYYDDEYYYDYPSACGKGELKMQVTHRPVRCGKITKSGDRLTMHYTGKLENGQKFDSSLDRNKPFQFTLGVGQVIAGWDSGLEGMCVGEQRTLVIPPDLAYGEQGVGAVIPACSTLVFDVELIDLEN